MELKGEETGEEMAAKVEKEPYVTQSGRRMKRTAKVDELWEREVGHRFLASF